MLFGFTGHLAYIITVLSKFGSRRAVQVNTYCVKEGELEEILVNGDAKCAGSVYSSALAGVKRGSASEGTAAGGS